MTVLLGPCPCASCGELVTVVRRPVLIAGHRSCQGRNHPLCVSAESTAELREVVPLDSRGERHQCTAGAA